MDNINLEKFIYKDLQSKNYYFYCSKNYNSNSNYLPQIYAIKTSSFDKQFLIQQNLIPVSLTSQKIYNILHKRPVIVVKNFTASNALSDNLLLCSILKEGISHLSIQDVFSSLEKYLINIQTLFLIENVFSTSKDKNNYFKLFSKNLTLQGVNLKNLDVFLSKYFSTKEKEDFIFLFISKRSKELCDINVDKKFTNYLIENWSDNISYLEKFFPFSQYLTNQICPNNINIFDSYSYSTVIEINLLKTSNFIGLTTNKINIIADKFFKEVQKYHNAQMKTINDLEHTTFVLQHNDKLLNKTYIEETFYKLLTSLLKNDIQKIDLLYCEKWYFHEVISKKIPSINTISTYTKI